MVTREVLPNGLTLVTEAMPSVGAAQKSFVLQGRRITVAFWDQPMEAGVDTPADLERVRGKLGQL